MTRRTCPERLLELNDEQLAVLAQQGDEDALAFLLERCIPLVKSCISPFYMTGAESDDILQEGMIGLYRAVRLYRNDRNASFRAFAALCIRRQVITAMRSASRKKHIPLNSYISIDKPSADDEAAGEMSSLLAGAGSDNPENLVLGGERLSEIHSIMTERLSKFERLVFDEYVDGKSYQEIAEKVRKPVKSVDNAIQRVKRKLMLCLP